MAGLQARANGPQRVVQARLDRAARDADQPRDVVDGSVLPVAQDDDDAMVTIECVERPIEVRVAAGLRRRAGRVEADGRCDKLDSSATFS